jgi:hypothetical protein|tara:strand:- start:931 stop:1512 length:582 start_codon:yes stop_codon:yes gene_type:complete
MRIYILHTTSNLQDYNDHQVFTSWKEVVTKFQELVKNARAEANEIYTDEYTEFYFDGSEGSEKIYITEHNVYDNERYARQCSITDEGMNQGWIDEDTGVYFKYKKDAVQYVKNLMMNTYESEGDSAFDIDKYKKDDDIIDVGFNHYNFYWTSWEDEADLQYKLVDGELIEDEEYMEDQQAKFEYNLEQARKKI